IQAEDPFRSRGGRGRQGTPSHVSYRTIFLHGIAKTLPIAPKSAPLAGTHERPWRTLSLSQPPRSTVQSAPHTRTAQLRLRALLRPLRRLSALLPAPPRAARAARTPGAQRLPRVLAYARHAHDRASKHAAIRRCFASFCSIWHPSGGWRIIPSTPIAAIWKI